MKQLLNQQIEQVWFVHNYVRFVFGDFCLDLFCTPRIKSGNLVLKYGDSNYCDTLVSFIGQKVIAVQELSNRFELNLDNSAVIQLIIEDPEYNAPEYALLRSVNDDSWWVW